MLFGVNMNSEIREFIRINAGGFANKRGITIESRIKNGTRSILEACVLKAHHNNSKNVATVLSDY